VNKVFKDHLAYLEFQENLVDLARLDHQVFKDQEVKLDPKVSQGIPASPVKLVFLDQKDQWDHRVYLVTLALLDQWDHPVTMASMENQEKLVFQDWTVKTVKTVTTVKLDLLEKPELKVIKENLALLVNRVKTEKTVLRENRVLPDRKDQEVQLELQENEVSLEKVDKPENLVFKDHVGNLVLLVQLVRPADKVLPANPVHEDTKVTREILVKADWTAKQVPQVQKVLLEHLENEDLLVSQVNEVTLVAEEKTGNGVHWVHVGIPVSWVNLVQLVHAVHEVNLVTLVQWV